MTEVVENSPFEEPATPCVGVRGMYLKTEVEDPPEGGDEIPPCGNRRPKLTDHSPFEEPAPLRRGGQGDVVLDGRPKSEDRRKNVKFPL